VTLFRAQKVKGQGHHAD